MDTTETSYQFSQARILKWTLLVAILAMCGRMAGAAESFKIAPPDLTIYANRPYSVPFKPQQARFVRIVIHPGSMSQPCIDELEIYGRDNKLNLGLMSAGAKATASSCLPNYAIHQIRHLNDGHYGNSQSWIAAHVVRGMGAD